MSALDEAYVEARNYLGHLERTIRVFDDPLKGLLHDRVEEMRLFLKADKLEKDGGFCKKPVHSRPYWMGVDQWDQCYCAKLREHEGECDCQPSQEGTRERNS